MIKTILLYEKDTICSKIYAEFFEQQGFNTICVTTIDEFLSSIKSQPIDVIITDAKILLNSATDFFNHIQRLSDSHPIIFLSEKKYSSQLKEKIAPATHKTIEKPVTLIQMLSVVNHEINEFKNYSTDPF